AVKHLDDVRLHAQGTSVLLARGAVDAPLEGTDVAERAAVRTAHVRVERPSERHALHPRKRALAGLVAIFGPSIQQAKCGCRVHLFYVRARLAEPPASNDAANSRNAVRFGQ